MHRKEFIKFSGVGVLAAALLPSLALCNFSPQNRSVKSAGKANPDFMPNLEIELTSVQRDIELFPGQKTTVFTYLSRMLRGDDSSLQALQNSYLGPIIKVKQGQKVRIIFKNQLSEESIIHWHGLHIPHEMDGHPMYVIDRDEEFVYEFEINNRPGTYWFHPHPHGKTGPQVYGGLAGLFIVEDQRDDLPSADQDVPLVIQDRIFDDSNQLVYLQGSPMERMTGFLGNHLMINGRPDAAMNVVKGTYRFRILNGSNSRIYKLAWSDGEHLTLIGTDGGLLAAPLKKPYLMLGPGERVEVWRDFSEHPAGTEITLQSLSFNSGTSMGMMGNRGMRGRGMGGMMGGAMGQAPAGVENGAGFDLFTFVVSNTAGQKMSLPAEFGPIKPVNIAEAVNPNAPRQFNFHFQRMQWLINGKTFDTYEVADWEKVKLNTTEIWEFVNGGGGGMGMMGNRMQMPHPVHVHGLQFQIIDRDPSGVPGEVWRDMQEGFVDQGWQDTFLLLPGERVRIALRFEDFKGIFLYHCHNLEHEDMGMMRNYEVI